MTNKMLQSICIAIISLFFLYGCTQPVGEKCIYAEPIKGNATIKSIQEGECIVDFRPSGRVWAEWSVEKRFQDMGAECQILGKITVGRTYTAIYEKEIAGSCKPYRVIVYDKAFIKKRPDLAKMYHLE